MNAPFSNPTTSRRAADSVKPVLGHLEKVCLQYLDAKPSTCEEIELFTGLPHQTASARVRALVLKKKIVDSGITRATKSGRQAIVWTVITPTVSPHQLPLGIINT